MGKNDSEFHAAFVGLRSMKWIQFVLFVFMFLPLNQGAEIDIIILRCLWMMAPCKRIELPCILHWNTSSISRQDEHSGGEFLAKKSLTLQLCERSELRYFWLLWHNTLATLAKNETFRDGFKTQCRCIITLANCSVKLATLVSWNDERNKLRANGGNIKKVLWQISDKTVQSSSSCCWKSVYDDLEQVFVASFSLFLIIWNHWKDMHL